MRLWMLLGAVSAGLLANAPVEAASIAAQNRVELSVTLDAQGQASVVLSAPGRGLVDRAKADARLSCRNILGTAQIYLQNSDRSALIDMGRGLARGNIPQASAQDVEELAISFAEVAEVAVRQTVTECQRRGLLAAQAR